jgi:hypothetical protein
MNVSGKPAAAPTRIVPPVASYLFSLLNIRASLLLALCFSICSCTVLRQSQYLYESTVLPKLSDHRGILMSESGQVPYQKWRVPPWDDELRYVWMVGHHDFRRSDKVELILYFHGMHSQDYYQAFRKELESLADARPNDPFLFVGFVDTPFVPLGPKSALRWKALTPEEGERPERLFGTVNRVFKAFRTTFPHMRKDKTSITLAGFSGGGRVLDAVGNWLTRNSTEDPYAEVFRSRLSKIVYFDCWFDKDVINTIPALLQSNPQMKIVGTVHMKKPVEHAALLAGKFKMKTNKKNKELIGLGGRLVIYRNESHWDAMISRLREAL